MTLENQVCSLELAKRLKELGVKQESCFWWCDPSDGDKADVGFIRDNHVGYKVFYSAFTVAELGELMHRDWRTHKKDNQAWFYNRHGEKNGRMFGPFPTEADARAICIIRRLERLKVDEINNALSPKI